MACGEHAAIVEYASVLSFSITISLLNLLKVWVEQLFAARMASVPVDASVVLRCGRLARGSCRSTGHPAQHDLETGVLRGGVR